jgi:hypothetical protein
MRVLRRIAGVLARIVGWFVPRLSVRAATPRLPVPDIVEPSAAYEPERDDEVNVRRRPRHDDTPPHATKVPPQQGRFGIRPPRLVESRGWVRGWGQRTGDEEKAG